MPRNASRHRSDNPARFYDRSLLRERRDPIQPPDPRDVDTVIASAPPAMAKIMRLLDATGMRANEAVTLSADDVNFDRRQISLTRTKTNRPRTIASGSNWGISKRS
jgi:integrase/recombinase XerD